MHNPIATYRLQFNEDFTFDDFEQITSYLQKLGVRTIYASPIFEAVPGSTHGYDGVNPTRINPEIGTEEQLLKISHQLKADHIGWLQDIVPNHMGVHPNNTWLMDVLEKGKQSKYALFFDTSLTSGLFDNKPVMMPFLGNSLEEVIERKELTVAYQGDKLVLKYFDNYWPLKHESYAKICGNAGDLTSKQLSEINLMLDKVNADPELIKETAVQQHYRLCSYEETDYKINYRRFFTVNSLMCINIQQPEVFKTYHQLIKKLIDNGTFTGLRIDHIDGLYDPKAYLDHLRTMAGNDTYIVAEKILEEGELLPTGWPIEGTTGYDFLAQVNNLLTDRSSAKKFTGFYQDLVKDKTPVDLQIKQKKAAILNGHMQGELNNLLQYFLRLNLAEDAKIAEVGVGNLKKAIGMLLINCPVYRYYGNQMPLHTHDAAALKYLLSQLEADEQLKEAAALLENVLLVQPLENRNNFNGRALKFYQRLMQFTGPLMAKGVEDTLMYTYNRFVGHNEVGDAPNAFGTDVKDFHKLMRQRQKQWPQALNATSTHDTKRGEDVRARLNVLTAIPDQWLATVKQWQSLESKLPMPYANDKYFIYQTITGAHPMPGQGHDNLTGRLREYLVKALREGKQNSNWAKPNEAYEKATLDFAESLLDQKGAFWPSFSKFHKEIADHGVINSLTQVLLKFTCPGVPDVYQGCELWDLSLVDPDNRRPVDYRLREKLLNEWLPANPDEQFSKLWETRYNGRVKLWLIQQLFKLRSSESELFAKGDYIPLKVKGIYKENIIAFARRYQGKWLIVAAPLYTAAICSKQGTEPTNIDWKDTRIVTPPEAPAGWRHIFAEKEFNVTADILIADIFNGLPFAILQSANKENHRGAGVLMHISSLPSNFGIGDLGPGAKTFANFLSRCGQKYWQLLPLNPTDAAQNHSPYSSLCSMAGNTLLISPVLLVKDGLLNEDDLSSMHLPQTDKVDFAEVEGIKQQIFDTAYDNFQREGFVQLKKSYINFCDTEAHWLDDFALYAAIRHNHDGRPWYEWDEQLKMRDNAALEEFKARHLKSIDKIKWLQFIFYRQWHQLRDYCKALNIKLIGDLPFYVGYDSADVWANRHLFALDNKGSMIGTAGVPPDYFNADGQLWGMPVYNWEAVKTEGYSWWINRLKKNMELFDLVRLDHFRAFASYWQVPAGELTAKNGKWVTGPGTHFFDAIQKALGSLPFIAEDLGDIDDAVFSLRDHFNLPGMKVLQFAFGNEMPQSFYIPHNYNQNTVVYTGTHDNNTILGWYDNDTEKETKINLAEYAGLAVKRRSINDTLIRMAYASTANLAIVPMQDLLKLDEHARMNNPSSTENNWLWRMLPKLVSADIDEGLLKLVKLYNRL